MSSHLIICSVRHHTSSCIIHHHLLHYLHASKQLTYLGWILSNRKCAGLGFSRHSGSKARNVIVLLGGGLLPSSSSSSSWWCSWWRHDLIDLIWFDLIWFDYLIMRETLEWSSKLISVDMEISWWSLAIIAIDDTTHVAI